MFQFLVSCEHGGNLVPEKFKPYFEEDIEILKTHAGWDIGILPIAQTFSKQFGFPLHYAEVTRLLVELNRSPNSPDLFSKFTNPLPDSLKKEIQSEYYFPYRDKIESEIRKKIQEGRKVIHLSFHSFTPVLNGDIRKTDIGLLFDPKMPLEVGLCENWSMVLQNYIPDFNIEFNAPYKGTDDGFTTYLRTKFKNSEYGGIEIEINQKYLATKNNIQKISEIINSSFQEVRNQFYN
jgi:predicted N-formylglutamate amidohydrolase